MKTCELLRKDATRTDPLRNYPLYEKQQSMRKQP
jgi:hypothetical protein